MNVLILGGLGLAAYLLGAVPTGYLLGRAKGIDIRTAGSGNIGATNVFRVLGKGWGILVFAVDAAKGFIPAFTFPMLACTAAAGPECNRVMGLVFGALAIAGHNWPVYLGFKGGKGVATGAGALLGVAPLVFCAGLLCWIVVFLGTRYVSVASISAALVAAVAAWILPRGDGVIVPATLTALCAILIARHRANIKRLIEGRENRFRLR